jgi:hypothetical protein
MEIFYKIGSVLLVTIWPLILQINGTVINTGSSSDLINGVVTDTTKQNSQIKVNHFYLDIIPPSSGVQFYKDGIIFLSSTKNNKKMVSRHISFGTPETFWAIPGDSVPGTFNVFSTTGFFPYPCDAMTFSNDYSTMYFTKYSKTTGKEKIFKAVTSVRSDGSSLWSENTEPLDICRDNYNYTHPALSSDGKIMVFASDRTGSAGGMDLYYSVKERDIWTVPVNLGSKINTRGNELFPSLDSDNNLFFSSDGLPGNGGYDIFMSKYNGTGWEKPVNLSKAINSNNDDIAFTINRKDGKSAFFSTRTKSRSGETHLFKVGFKNGIVVKEPMNLTATLYSLASSESDAGKANIADLSKKTDNITKEVPVAAVIRDEKKPDAGIKADSIKTSGNEIMAENNRIIAARHVADSIEAARVEAERIKEARLKADKAEAARIEAERLQAQKARTDSINAARSVSYKTGNENAAVYRVQLASYSKPKGKYEISVNGKSFTTFEYLYLGAYRVTIGEFTTLKAAVELQNICRKSGYPQAFVVAFLNNLRSNAPELFK